MARTVDGGCMSSWLSDSGLIAEPTLDAIHDAFTAVYQRLGEDSFETLVGDLEGLLDHYEAAFRTDPAAWLELRRRIAETKLTIALTKGRPMEECERLLGELQHLGWSDLGRRAQVEAMFCGYWSRHGRTPQVLPYLMPLKAKLEAEHARTGETVWANYLNDCQVILDRLDDGRGRDDHDQ